MGLKKQLEAKQSVMGPLLGLRSSDAAELMSESGFDFLLVDAEHSSIGPDGILEMIRATERGSAVPLVRVAEARPSHVQWSLDAGAKGILFPRVRSVEDVKHAVSLCRYPPDGVRGLGPGRASAYGAKLLDYAAVANDEILVMIQIETMEAVESVEQIAAVPGVDLLFIGPGDLSQVLGVPGDLHHAEIRKIGSRVLSACAKEKVPAGILALEEKTIGYWKEQGMQFFAIGSDALFLAKSCRESVSLWKKLSE